MNYPTLCKWIVFSLLALDLLALQISSRRLRRYEIYLELDKAPHTEKEQVRAWFQTHRYKLFSHMVSLWMTRIFETAMVVIWIVFVFVFGWL